MLGRDPDWIDLNVQYALYVVRGALITRMFPDFLKPSVIRVRLSEPWFST